MNVLPAESGTFINPVTVPLKQHFKMKACSEFDSVQHVCAGACDAPVAYGGLRCCI